MSAQRSAPQAANLRGAKNPGQEVPHQATAVPTAPRPTIRAQSIRVRTATLDADEHAHYRDERIKLRRALIDRFGYGEVPAELFEDVDDLVLTAIETGQSPRHDDVIGELAEQAEEHAVAAEVRKIRRREEARRRVDAATSSSDPLPHPVTLTRLLDEPAPEQPWRIHGLWPADARVNIVAAPKAGKTTLLTNVIRSLVDGQPFLGTHPTAPVPHGPDRPAVVVFDFEMTRHQLQDWYRAQRITATDGVVIVPLHGYASGFNFLNPTVRDDLVTQYAGAHTYVLDPVSPVLSALGMEENSNADVQRFLSEWDTFVRLLGGRESAVVVHAGHNVERARGASAFLGSGAAIWTLVRDGEETTAPRYIKATGRDVDLPETAVTYDTVTRRLVATGGNRQQNRAEAEAQNAVPYVLAALEDRGTLTKSGLETYIANKSQGEGTDGERVPRAAIRKAIDLALADGSIAAEPGPRKSINYMLRPRRDTAARSPNTPATEQGTPEEPADPATPLFA